jgi:hypothetical protein
VDVDTVATHPKPRRMRMKKLETGIISEYP